MGVRRKRRSELLGWSIGFGDPTCRTPTYRRRERDSEIEIMWFRDRDCVTVRVHGPGPDQYDNKSVFVANLPVEGNNIAETLQRVNLMLKYGGLTALATLKEAMDTLRAL